MTPIEIVAEWLKVKVKAVKVNNPTANKGLLLLRNSADYEEKLTLYMANALQIIVTRLSNDNNGMPHGLAKFTETAIAIGKYIEYAADMPELLQEKHCAIGACFIGALHSNGYLDLYRDPGFSEHSKRAPTVIEPTDLFSTLRNLSAIEDKLTLLATTYGKIKNIDQMLQGHGRNLVKSSNEEIEEMVLQSIEDNEDWIQAANKLQQQSWKINREVFEIVDREFYSLIEDVPPRPRLGSKQAVEEAFKKLKKDKTQVARDKYNQATRLWNTEKEILVAHSKNMEKEVVRKKATALLDSGIFYQYVEIDYRGRCYYQEPLMNFQGPDVSRGLMLFGEGKPITEMGIRWLARHIAVCYNQTYNISEIPDWADPRYKEILEEQGLDSISVDKMTFDDRETWTFENLEFIMESRKSLNNKAEKPVSFLAACLEWFKCGGDPEYVSHLPIPIDGSCNGYQHSAAISKDEITGSLVSLVPQEIQEDLYVVAAKELVARNKDFFDARPDMKMKHIRKGISKRAVMTRAYSAGKATISDSMYSDCYKEGYIDQFDIDMMNCLDLGESMYHLIGDVCPGATKTMKFMQNLATFQLGKFKHYGPDGKIVSKAKMKKLHATKQTLKKIKNPTLEDLRGLNEVSKTLDNIEVRKTYGNGSRYLEWSTPSGFHVIYEAYFTRQLDIEVTVPGYVNNRGTGRIKCVLQIPTEKPDVQKYQAGVAPNYIHSQDAAHMAITIANWEGSFGAVHDSFSTHACDVEDLAELTRNSFYAMYNHENYFEIIRDVFLHGDNEYDLELPEIGKLDIEDVRTAQYFFN